MSSSTFALCFYPSVRPSFAFDCLLKQNSSEVYYKRCSKSSEINPKLPLETTVRAITDVSLPVMNSDMV